MAVQKGASAMLEVLATRVEGMGDTLSEVRQDVKETRQDVQDIRERLVGMEKEVAYLRERIGGSNGKASTWTKEAFNLAKMLVIALLAALGVKYGS